VSNFITTG